MKSINYSLYLVTGRHLLPSNKVFYIFIKYSSQLILFLGIFSVARRGMIIISCNQTLRHLRLHLNQAIQGGVTLVQVREKELDTEEVSILTLQAFLFNDLLVYTTGCALQESMRQTWGFANHKRSRRCSALSWR